MSVNDYSTDPGTNITIGGINVAENCPPGNINNAIRQQMADIASWRDFLLAAGTSPFALLAGATFTGNVKAPSFRIDTNYYLALSGSDPLINFNPSAAIVYDRTNALINFVVAGVTQVAIANGTANVRSLTASSSITANGGVNIPFGSAVQFGGTQIGISATASDSSSISGSSQWRVLDSSFANELLKVANGTGNMVVRGSASIANDPAFLLSKVGANPVLTYDTGDSQYFDRTLNAHGFNVGGATKFTISGTAVNSAVPIYRDATFYLDLTGSSAVLNLDTTDYFGFDRTTNVFNFVSSGTVRMAISSGGAVTATSFNPTSDARLKTEIADVDPTTALAMIRRIGGKHYLKNGVPEFGIIAQDAQEAGLGDLVHEGPDGMLAFNYNGLSAIINATLINLDDRLSALEAAA